MGGWGGRALQAPTEKSTSKKTAPKRGVRKKGGAPPTPFRHWSRTSRGWKAVIRPRKLRNRPVKDTERI